MNPAVAADVPDPCAITAARLVKLSPALGLDHAGSIARAMEMARGIADLTTSGRVRHWLAQTATETNGFTQLVENLRYRDAKRLDQIFSAVRGIDHARRLIAAGPVAIANCVYAGRLGNGDEASGDGFKFRGRGFLHLTGRENYRMFGRVAGLDLEHAPELLERDDHAATAAALFWKARNINRYADADDLVGVTRMINPALAGLDDRRAWLGRARKVFP